MNYDNTFSGILDACSDLTPYGVTVRYPNELAVDEVLAKLAVDKAGVIYNFCSGKIAENNSDEEE